MNSDHAGRNNPHAGEHVHRSCYGLGIKEVGNDEKIGQKNKQHRITRCSHFKQLQGQHDHKQCDTGVTPE
jgi:hypothetical protein